MRLQTNTKTLEDLCSQSMETVSQAIHDAVTTHQVTASHISRWRQPAPTQTVPHHDLDLWSLAQFFYHHINQYAQLDLDFATDGNLRELSGEQAWETIENFAQGKKEWNNPPNIISEQEIKNLKVHAKRLFGNDNVWVQMHRGLAWDKVENPDPQRIPIEVEPLDETPLEDLVFNTCNHDIPLSSKEIPSIDEPEPQQQPLPNCLSLDVSLREERGPEPPIKPHSPDSFRMKEVDSLTINKPPSPHMASSHHKDSVGYSIWECFDDDWGLESKEVSPLGEELSLFNRPNEVERGQMKLYLMRRSLEVLRKFHWMILGGRFNQLSHVLPENIRDNVQNKSHKSPTKSLFDVGSSRISIFIVKNLHFIRMFWQYHKDNAYDSKDSLVSTVYERQENWKCVLTRLIDDLLALDSIVRLGSSDQRLELTATFSISTDSE
ncbi:hypothetical protein Tco_0849182 [Tanacetum coccineum]